MGLFCTAAAAKRGKARYRLVANDAFPSKLKRRLLFIEDRLPIERPVT